MNPHFGRVSVLSISFFLSLRNGVAVITKRFLNVLVLKCACGGFSFAVSLFFLALCYCYFCTLYINNMG